jgi:hypothetical protein
MSVQASHFNTHWFTLFLTVNQWEWIGWLANPLIFYIIPYFSIYNLSASSWFLSWLSTQKI